MLGQELEQTHEQPSWQRRTGKSPNTRCVCGFLPRLGTTYPDAVLTRAIATEQDLYLRSRAEFENLQKRTAREKQTAKDYAIQSFAKDLVNDLDVLQLALRSVDEPSRTGPEAGKIKDLWEGVNSTRKMLEQTLGRFGVTSFDPEGQAFDPNKHEAIFQAPIPGKEPNTVVCQKVLPPRPFCRIHHRPTHSPLPPQIGWMLRDRILRPAQVGVVQESG